MIRAPFYEVKKEAYLFPQDQKEGKRQYPEEKVRQWCIFELIRAYGIHVQELEFERSVKIGSQTYWIDILVLLRGQPWIVVECKKIGHKKASDAMAQAKSYADSPVIKAPFALYTNGEEWHVERRIRDNWYPVPDLPLPQGELSGIPFEQVMYAVRCLAPLLNKLHQRLEGAAAQKFFSDMQWFFDGNLLITDFSNDLIHAIDLILRILSDTSCDHHYWKSKLSAACRSIVHYRLLTDGCESNLSLADGITLNGAFDSIHAELYWLSVGTKGLPGLDVLLLRLAFSLTDYGKVQKSVKVYPSIPESLHTTLREYLDVVLTLRLNTYLPEIIDTHSFKALQDSCKLE